MDFSAVPSCHFTSSTVKPTGSNVGGRGPMHDLFASSCIFTKSRISYWGRQTRYESSLFWGTLFYILCGGNHLKWNNNHSRVFLYPLWCAWRGSLTSCVQMQNKRTSGGVMAVILLSLYPVPPPPLPPIYIYIYIFLRPFYIRRFTYVAVIFRIRW